MEKNVKQFSIVFQLLRGRISDFMRRSLEEQVDVVFPKTCIIEDFILPRFVSARSIFVKSNLINPNFEIATFCFGLSVSRYVFSAQNVEKTISFAFVFC